MSLSMVATQLRENGVNEVHQMRTDGHDCSVVKATGLCRSSEEKLVEMMDDPPRGSHTTVRKPLLNVDTGYCVSFFYSLDTTPVATGLSQIST